MSNGNEGAYFEYDCQHTPEDTLRVLIASEEHAAMVRLEVYVIDPDGFPCVRLTNEDARDLATRILAALPDSDD